MYICPRTFQISSFVIQIIEFFEFIDETNDKRAVEYGAEEMGKAPREMELPSNPPMPVVIGFVKGPDGEEIEFFQPL